MKTHDFECPKCHGNKASIGRYADGTPAVECPKCHQRMKSRELTVITGENWLAAIHAGTHTAALLAGMPGRRPFTLDVKTAVQSARTLLNV